eukprot:TRINITY_DN84462_c0_g1_i1.p1 TRINITY_DN84462_c0_g1~~TRINITY_DN84462_c0_g1_i1.p1  ORF type:complete len:132 (-),score=32.86 TRINITY_DN84462_c0_g1_i1:136-531(-)
MAGGRAVIICLALLLLQDFVAAVQVRRAHPLRRLQQRNHKASEGKSHSITSLQTKAGIDVTTPRNVEGKHKMQPTDDAKIAMKTLTAHLEMERQRAAAAAEKSSEMRRSMQRELELHKELLQLLAMAGGGN